MNDRVYRADIEGLRAIAVLTVVGYHYGSGYYDSGLFPAGYVGVDVFFVISGYLITSTIYVDILAGRFSLIAFYDRRLRRILPAALCMMAFVLVAGFFILVPSDFASTARSAAYSSLGLANVYFWQNTGYFDRQAQLQPLLHMWSLAVEEQFYLMWPVIMFGLWSLMPSRRVMATTLSVIVISSFAAYAAIVIRAPQTAFYMPHTRAWELGLGALLVFIPSIGNRFVSEIAVVAGLVLIVIGVANKASLFPGAAVMIPCVGAALVIWPKAQETIAARALSLPPMTFFGRISYSLYLWHWPLLVLFHHYANGEQPAPMEMTALAAASIIIGTLSLKLVENPIRKMRPARKLATIFSGMTAAGLTCGVAAYIVHSDGFALRTPPAIKAVGAGAGPMWVWPCAGSMTIAGRSYCAFGENWGPALHKGFLWGDSHAGHFAPLVEVAIQGTGYAFALVGDDCPAILGGNVHRYAPASPYLFKCAALHRETVDYLKDHPEIDIVAFAGRWSTILPTLYRGGVGATRAEAGEFSKKRGASLLYEEFSRLIRELETPGRRFVVFGDVPQWHGPDPLSCLVSHRMRLLRKPCGPENLMISAEQFREYHRLTYDDLDKLTSTAPNTTVILPGRALCDQLKCATEVDGEFIYRDVDHIRRDLPENIKRRLVEMFGLDRIFW